MPVHLCRPIRGPRLSLTPFGMCRSTPSPSNSRSFCRYKTPSHLHISQLLKVPQFQRFAQKSCLTPLTCADTQMRGWGGASLYPASLQIHPPTETPMFSVAYTLPISMSFCFQQFTTSEGGGGVQRTRPPSVRQVTSHQSHQSPVTESPVTESSAKAPDPAHLRKSLRPCGSSRHESGRSTPGTRYP